MNLMLLTGERDGLPHTVSTCLLHVQFKNESCMSQLKYCRSSYQARMYMAHSSCSCKHNKTFTKKQAKLIFLAGLKLHPYILKHIMYVCSPVEQCFSLFSRTNSIGLDILLRHGQSSTTGAHAFRLLTFRLANRLYTLHQFVFIHQGKQIIGLWFGLSYYDTLLMDKTNYNSISFTMTFKVLKYIYVH